LKFKRGSAYDDLTSRFGQFYYVVSLEVVEHVFAPRKYAATLYNLCNDNGIEIISTPYHGYWNNLALALAGKFDFHFTALLDYGHIKFWSINTLGVLLKEAGFREIVFYRVGRIPPLAKSMIAVARR
jgi:2-polyprenyl-6-hydroxyphenyl methylase/3-demethylubiquinone-9 3-methyltransferase